MQEAVVIHSPWPLTKLAEALNKTPEAVRVSISRGRFPIAPRYILGRLYFDVSDVRRLLAGERHPSKTSLAGSKK